MAVAIAPAHILRQLWTFTAARRRVGSIALSALMLGACAGGASDGGGVDASANPNAASVGGAVAGLGASKAVVLGNVDIGGEVLQKAEVSANGRYTLAVATGARYDVRVLTQPAGQICKVARATGTVTATVSDADASCADNAGGGVSISGEVTGLASGRTAVLVRDAGPAGASAEELTVSANGVFTFARPVTGTYTVRVKSQPVNGSCAVLDGAGTTQSANITNVKVRCTNGAGGTDGNGSGTATFRVGGTIEGLPGGRLFAINNNGADTLSLQANGNFTFVPRYAPGTAYNVAAATPPDGPFTCVISAGQGTVTTADVTSVRIVCASTDGAKGSVGAKLSGLHAGTHVVLQSTGAGNLTLTTNGDATFPDKAPVGASVAVTVSGQPDIGNCVVSGSPVTVQANTTVFVNVDCAVTQEFNVGGTVTGLAGAMTITFKDAVTGETMTRGNGAFTFPQRRPVGTAYNVQIIVMPVACTVTRGAGNVQGEVNNISIVCSA